MNQENSKYCLENTALYVHVPFCTSKCRYCGFYSQPIGKYDVASIIAAMITEMDHYEIGDKIQTVYIGGGSPSCLEKNHLLKLIDHIAKKYPAAGEFTIEVNPGQVDQDLLDQLRTAGVNRLSIGAQSFIQNELYFLGRKYSVDQIRSVVCQSRSAGFDNISLDLIFAIPGSSLESWKHNLDLAIQLSPDHISAYGLTFEENTPLNSDVQSGLVTPIDEDTERAMYEMTIDNLAGAGIEQYEISNFSRDGFQCRHNLNYWANGSYLGIGPAAVSYLQGTRRTNFTNIEKYAQAIKKGLDVIESSETLNNLDRACETAVLNLRRIKGLDLAEFEIRTGFDAMQLFTQPIDKYKKLGLINTDKNRIWLTRDALAIADSILCDFAAV